MNTEHAVTDFPRFNEAEDARYTVWLLREVDLDGPPPEVYDFVLTVPVVDPAMDWAGSTARPWLREVACMAFVVACAIGSALAVTR